MIVHMKIIFIFTLPFLICLACSPGYVRGLYIDTLLNRYNGLVKFTPCFDVHYDTVAGIRFKGTAGGKPLYVPVSSIERVVTGADTFIALPKGRVIGLNGHSVDHDLFARVVESGPLTLLRFCEIDYQATMIKVRRMEVQWYVVRRQDGLDGDVVPYSPADFIALMGKHMSDDPVLCEEIRNANYVQKIANPTPGCITEYEGVTEQQIRDFVKRYNSRRQGR